ncbi:MAG: hypothetical protein LBR76_02995, partial [Oscillospiraceae bacterium]|nr:hypothetical protein [Oscillospiraceae bacterium]
MSLFDVADDSPLPILPGVEEQRTKIEETLSQEAAEVQAASSLERSGVDEVLLDITVSEKSAIAEQFADNPRSRDAVNLVKEIYGDTLPIPIPQAVKRITELLAEGAFTTLDQYTLLEQVRDELSERGYSLSGEVIEDAINTYNGRDGKGGVLDVADFIEDIYLVENPGFEEEANVSEPQEKIGLTLYRAGDFYEFRGLTAESIAAFLESTTVLRDGESVYGFPAHRLEEIERKLTQIGYSLSVFEEPKPQTRPYQTGDTVWLDNREFLIETIGDSYKTPDDLDRKFGIYGRSITLLDVALARTYPITRSMYQAEFENALSLDDRNAHLSALGEPEPQQAEMPSHMDSEDELTETEMELSLNDPAELDFDAIAEEIYEQVLNDREFAETVSVATSRSALRGPLNAVLDAVIAGYESEPRMYLYLSNDDIADKLFEFVYLKAWADKLAQEAVTEQPAADVVAADEADDPPYDQGDTFYMDDGKPYIINWVGFHEIGYHSPETPHISKLMERADFEILLRNTPRDSRIAPPPETPEGFTEIIDPAELAEIERVFGGQEQAEPIAVIDNVSRNNYNLFALAFPRLIDGTYQSMTFKNANKRELSVSYATTNADIINLDVSYTKPDGHSAFVPMIQFHVNHEQRMLTVNGY